MANKKDRYLICYAVLSAAIVVCCVALIPVIEDAMQPNLNVPTPTGSFGGVTLKSRYEIVVGFGNCTPAVNYSQCSIAIVTPEGERGMVDLKAGKYTYSLVGSMAKLTELRLSDSGSFGRIENGDAMTLFHNYPIELGVWSVELVYKASEKPITVKKVVSNDPDSAPTGSFMDAALLNPSTYQLKVNQINPSTAYSYCKLTIDPPGTNGSEARTFKLADKQNQYFFYNGQIRVTISATNDDGVIGMGDTLEITTSASQLPQGQWLVSLDYSFNGAHIAQKTFTLGSS